MTLVDSSVPIDPIEDHPHWRIKSEDALVGASSADELAINVLIYAEISRSVASGEAEYLFAQHRYRGRSDFRRCRPCGHPRTSSLSRCRLKRTRVGARYREFDPPVEMMEGGVRTQVSAATFARFA